MLKWQDLLTDCKYSVKEKEEGSHNLSPVTCSFGEVELLFTKGEKTQ